jgi:hypothetical protein
MISKSLKTAALAAMVGSALMIAAPAATADTTCQPLAEGVTACVSTTGDPTTGHFGVRVTADRLNLCLTVFERCPDDPR